METSTSPASLTAKRARVACLACQRRKQKCDGQSPACRNCLRANRTCIIEDPATKRQHPRGYIEELEQRVALLQDALHSAQPSHADNSRTAGPADLIPPRTNDDLTHQSTNPDIDTSDSSPHRHDVPPETPSGLELLCLQSAGGEPHYFGSSSAYSFTKAFSSALRAVRAQGPGLSMGGVSDASMQNRPKPTPAPLPERSVVTLLTLAYFENVHPQFPFLHRPTFLTWEEEVLTATECGYSPHPVHLFFVYMVASIGALTGPFAGAILPESLYAAAENLLEHVLQSNTLEAIQAILCCAMYSLRSPVGVSVWSLSGLALRQCIELGLHRNIPWSKVEPNALKAEMRRRVFWCSYNLDRAVAVTLGRPVGIMDHDMDVEFPLDINDEDITVSGLLKQPRGSQSDPSTTMSAAIHTIRIRKIWARIQAFMYPQTQQDMPREMYLMLESSFKNELKEWLDSAPEQLSISQANNNAFGSQEWFELMYYHSILLLHRHRLVSHPQGSENIGPTPPSVYVDCAQAAQSICHIYRQLYLKQRLNDTWGALHVLFLAGITYLHCLWCSEETRATFRQDKVSATCTSCVIVFVVMAERWSAVIPYRDAFDMLSNATQTMLMDAQTRIEAPSLPAISTTKQDRLSGYLSNIAELGMCGSVEELLCDMIG